MAHVQGVFQILKVVALARVGIDFQQTIKMFEFGVLGEFRRLPLGQFAEIGKDQSEILAHRIGADADLAGKVRLLGRLLDTLAVRGKGPAMIEAAQLMAFDPAR